MSSISRVAMTAVLAALSMAAVQCSPTATRPAAPPAPSVSTGSPGSPGSTERHDAAMADEVPTSVPTSRPAAPPAATVHPVDAAELGASWRPECPVGPEGLRRVNMAYRGLDGAVHRGDLIVAAELTDEVIGVFAQLFASGFPIATMRNVAAYPDAEDEASMADNNTSAYNCRRLPGGSGWSEHAYGLAVDINPLFNPYIDRRGSVEPANAGPWVDRTRTDPGMIVDGGTVVRLFIDRGWEWGGHWRTPKDYQHFEWP